MGARALRSQLGKRLPWDQGLAEFWGAGGVDPVTEIRGSGSAPPLERCVTLGKPLSLSECFLLCTRRWCYW